VEVTPTGDEGDERSGILPRWRAITYGLLAFNLCVPAWIVSGAGDAFYLVILLLAGDAVLGLTWVLTRRGATGHVGHLPPSQTHQHHPRNDFTGGGGGGGGGSF
jgi:hypothetical protein